MAAPSYIGSWKIRRRVVALTLVFCAGMVGYIILRGEDTALNREAVTALCLLAGGVIGSYVFGAAWDDKNIMRSGQ